MSQTDVSLGMTASYPDTCNPPHPPNRCVARNDCTSIYRCITSTYKRKPQRDAAAKKGPRPTMWRKEWEFQFDKSFRKSRPVMKQQNPRDDDPRRSVGRSLVALLTATCVYLYLYIPYQDPYNDHDRPTLWPQPHAIHDSVAFCLVTFVPLGGCGYILITHTELPPPPPPPPPIWHER
ncbi:hypothetical protein K504DRAFT_460061 [Pleomassaria siparia CBS 279.74]|uniref:Transmembrane protein n=1 Tax=Pleomassaria siparia CBS 279.74 TaxID=1314801 RepID=A0A6G1JZR6_9PLEO|nr:hypothetical protein K504DRAFT_460061 [Pleomassaria siparia CBS 279.74]